MQIEDLYVEYKYYVRNIIGRYFSGHYAYEEIVPEIESDVWYKICRHLSRFNGDSDIKTWIYRICINESKNKYTERSRKIKGQSQFGVKFLRRNWPRWDWNTPENNLIAEQEEQEIYKLYNDLPEKHQKVFDFIYLEGNSYKQCSKIFNLNMGTIKSRIHRVKHEIKKQPEYQPLPCSEDTPKVTPLPLREYGVSEQEN